MKHKLMLLLVLIGVILALALTACRQLDVIGNGAIASFAEVLDAIPSNIAADEENGGWALNAPDETARFIWSKDYSQSPVYDVMLEFDAQPFVEAGLDIAKLPDGMVYGDKIIVGANLGESPLTYRGEANPLASFEQIVKEKPASIGYHAALDHYGVNLGNGNMFEWAKDMGTNDKDIVFVLNPQPFMEAGVDPNKVEGWLFAKVETMDEKGKTVEVDKLLKPFALE